MYRTIVEESTENLIVMDVFSKLVQERIIFIDGPINDDLANGVIAQMLYLDSECKDEISIYINTPGGSVSNGLAIYDISKLITSPIKTVCIGMAASMGAVLMLMGNKRCGLKHSRFMLHQPSSAIIGTTEETRRSLKEMEELESMIYTILEEHTILTNIKEELMFDKWMGSKEALSYKLLTEIL